MRKPLDLSVAFGGGEDVTLPVDSGYQNVFDSRYAVMSQWWQRNSHLLENRDPKHPMGVVYAVIELAGTAAS